MSIIRITGDNLQYFRTIARPKRFFASSSSGVTGSFRLSADYSKSIKDVNFKITSGSFQDDSLENHRARIVMSVTQGQSDTHGAVSSYMDMVHSAKHSVKQTKKQEVRRYIPGTRLGDNFFEKFAVKNVLFPHYRNGFPSSNWAYTNYHSLNFFTSDQTPSDSVLIYPAGTGSSDQHNVNFLAPSGAFTFDFYIKPKATTIPYNAGTILHMSSCYAISLVTGSKFSLDGLPENYRLLFQLSQSADIPPSSIAISGDTISANVAIPTNHAFVTTQNSLERDRWHHVSIRWSGKDSLNGIGNITIDGKIDREFTINSSSIMQATSSSSTISDPDALFVGNYYEGNNASNNAIAKFFAPDIATSEGLTNFNSSLTNGNPGSYRFRHPLNAEIHDIKIYNRYLFDKQIGHTILSGSSLEPSLLFYVPPFFVKETRTRELLQTPFIKVTGSSESPFSIPMSFGVAGLDINLENFTRDFARKEYPRLLNLTSSYIASNVTQEGLTATDILYKSGSSRKRNLTILPCDNGNFRPHFDLLSTGSFSLSPPSGSAEGKFVNDLGLRDLSLISLNKMVRKNASLLNIQGTEATGSLSSAILSATPENTNRTLDSNEAGETFSFRSQGYYLNSGDILTVFQRTGDRSSNEVVFFDISNLFYGDAIQPETFKITDSSLTGSGGQISITLKDDGRGNLYRADARGKNASWASVGNIFYDDGIVVIKSPHLVHFGKNGYSLEFEGERSIHTMEYSIPVSAGMINSSSNPNFRKLIPTDYKTETAEEFVYMTGVQLHDNNLNVVMRTNFSQPIIKRDKDRILIKIRVDF